MKEKTDTLSLTAPEGWSTGELAESDLVYFRADSTGAENQPAETDTILYGSITGFTLAPEALPEEFDGLEQTDNLYEYVEEANDIDWIRKESVYDNLLDRVNTIREKIETGKINKAKNKLQDFVDYVQEKYDEDKLTKEARILLKQNANYIKRNL